MIQLCVAARLRAVVQFVGNVLSRFVGHYPIDNKNVLGHHVVTASTNLTTSAETLLYILYLLKIGKPYSELAVGIWHSHHKSLTIKCFDGAQCPELQDVICCLRTKEALLSRCLFDLYTSSYTNMEKYVYAWGRLMSSWWEAYNI